VNAFFMGKGVAGNPVHRTREGQLIIPEVGTKVRIKATIFVVDDVYHDYDRGEIRVYIQSAV